MIMLPRCRWNINRATDYLGLKPENCSDVPLLVAVNELASKQGVELPFPGYTDLPKTEELFGLQYTQHRLFDCEYKGLPFLSHLSGCISD